MKYFVLSLLLVISTDPREIAKVNAIKKEAEKAFLSGKYDEAALRYLKLDSLKLEDPALKLNLGHAYYHLKDTAAAKQAYQAATTVADKRMKSIAYQQLGVLDKQANKLEEALTNLKSSLKADPTNEGARYDYELVKKLLDKKQQEQQQNQNQEQQQNQNQENQDQQQNQQKDNQDQNGEKSDDQKEQEKQDKESEEKDGEKKEGENEDGEEKESDEQPKTPEEELKEKLEQMNMSEEKAQMILEALRNNEIQYLQQQKRKSTKRPASGKPDW